MIGAIDRHLLRLMRTRGHGPAVERAAVGLSAAGERGALWIALALGAAALDPLRRSRHLRAAAVVAGTFAANYGLKLVVRRRRPVLEGLPRIGRTISELSYPSAHASTSFVGAGLLARDLPSAPLYLTATAMAVSRPYLGAHYPSDVVAGAALGAAIARLVP